MILTNRTITLYALIVIFSIGIFGIEMYRRWWQYRNALPVPVDEEEVVLVPIDENDPILDDLMTDLFVGQLTGYVIGLIDGNEQELRFYRQLLDIIYSRYVFNVDRSSNSFIDTDTFVKQMLVEIQKLPSDNLQALLQLRLVRLVDGIETSPYYTANSKIDVSDIYDAISQSFNLIKHYDVIAIRRP